MYRLNNLKYNDSHLGEVFFVEARHVESVLEGLVDEGRGVVPCHGLLEEESLGQDLLRAQTASSQLSLHGGQDLNGDIMLHVTYYIVTLLHVTLLHVTHLTGTNITDQDKTLPHNHT